MVKNISDFFGKNGLDSTDSLAVKKIYKDVIVKKTNSAGLRNFDNIEKLLAKAKEFSNGPRVTPEGVKKLEEYLGRGNAETKFDILGLEKMKRSDIREFSEIFDFSEPEKPEEEPEEEVEE